MTLNCKHGDLARVISDDLGWDPMLPGMALDVHVAGFIVRCKTLISHHGRPAWLIEDAVNAEVSCATGRGTARIISDCLLRPIPGLDQLDGVDETLVRAGKPAPVDTPVAT